MTSKPDPAQESTKIALNYDRAGRSWCKLAVVCFFLGLFGMPSAVLLLFLLSGLYGRIEKFGGLVIFYVAFTLVATLVSAIWSLASIHQSQHALRGKVFAFLGLAFTFFWILVMLFL